MRGLKSWAWAAVIAALAAPASAQPTGTTGTTRPTTGGLTSGGAAPTGIGIGIGGGAGSTGFGTGGASGGQGGATLPQIEVAPQITAPVGTTSSSRDPVMGKFYGNPYFQGKDHTARNVLPGGFGTALYPATGGTGTTGARAGATGALGGRGGQAANTQSGILIPLPVQIHYTAQMRFPTPAIPATKLQADLRVVIDTGGLTNSKTVQVIANGTNIVLRGTVKDDEEARLAEGLVRLTPGVGNITNELTFPVASK